MRAGRSEEEAGTRSGWNLRACLSIFWFVSATNIRDRGTMERRRG